MQESRTGGRTLEGFRPLFLLRAGTVRRDIPLPELGQQLR